MQLSMERVLVVHEARDDQGDASDGGELLRPSQCSVPRPVLVQRDIPHPMETVPDHSVDAGGSCKCLNGISVLTKKYRNVHSKTLKGNLSKNSSSSLLNANHT